MPSVRAFGGGFPCRRANEPFDPEARLGSVGDAWTDTDRINQAANERVGYPTKKPLAVLERIIRASSNEGDVVFDPFCGCATALVAAETLQTPRHLGLSRPPIHRAKLFGCCERKFGIARPLRSPRRRSNGAALSPGPERLPDRRQRLLLSRTRLDSLASPTLRQPNAGAHPGPRQLAQPGEVNFSVRQSYAPTPNDFDSQDDVAERLHAVERNCEATATPVEWKFTRDDPDDLLRRMKTPSPPRDQLVA